MKKINIIYQIIYNRLIIQLINLYEKKCSDSDQKKTKTHTAKTLCLFIIFLINTTFGQNSPTTILPQSPQASALGKYGNIPVNLSSGRVEFEIPLYNISIGKFNFPIKLSYNYLGLQPSEPIGLVGRGWILNNRGVVNVNIRGNEDFSQNGYNNVINSDITPFLNGQITSSDKLESYLNKKIDTEPDYYSLSVGNLNSTFLYNNGNPILFGEKTIMFEKKNSGLYKFNIIDEEGNKYFFENYDIVFSDENTISQSVTAYNTTKIITPENQTINFTHIPTSRNVTSIYSQRKIGTSNTNSDHPCYDNNAVKNYYTNNNLLENIVSEITYNDTKITFEYDIIDTDTRLLKGIKVYNKNNKTLEYKLLYDQSKSLLMSINKINSDNSSEKYYDFDYYNKDFFSQNQNISKFNVDPYGYYNGESNNTNLIYGNKKIDFFSTQTGALKKIIYPTKGHSESVYEQNTYKEPVESEIDCDNFTYNAQSSVYTINNNTKTEDIYIPFPQKIKVFVQAVSFPLGSTSNDRGIIQAKASADISRLNAKISSCSPSDQIKAEIYVDNIDELGNKPMINQSYTTYIDVKEPGYIRINAESSNSTRTDNSSATTTIFYSKSKPSSLPIGGIRVKSIDDCTGDSPCIKKEYIYDDSNGVPSSIIKFKPFYSHYEKCGNFNRYEVLSSNSLTPLLSYSGSPVIYTKVKEVIKNKGYKETTFSSSQNISSYNYPSIPNDFFDYKLGRELESSVYDSNNKKIYSSTNDFEDITESDNNTASGFTIAQTNFNWSLSYDNFGYPVSHIFPPTVSDVSVSKYIYKPKIYRLKKSIKVENLNPSTNTTISEYQYSSFKHRLITNLKTNFSDNSVQETTYQYAHEKGNQKLINANMIGIPLQTTTTKDGKTIANVETKYDDPANLLPTSVLSYDLQNPAVSKTEITYDLYDNKRNILQYSEKGKPVTIIWGYGQTQPIAKIEGATYNQISAYVSAIIVASEIDNTQGTDQSEQALISALDIFRNNPALSGYQISTYTYNPLIGVTSITPPSGIREVYKYDAANRLESVKDVNGNILKEYQYRYKN